MKQICNLSGITWEAEGFATGRKHLVLPHPVFALPVKSLYARYDADWYAGRLSQVEKKLLFLAIFNASGHVSFNHPADPAPAIVETHMAALTKAVAWLLSIKHPGCIAPAFHINKETHKLENMSALLTAWYDAKQSFDEGARAQNLFAAKTRLETLLEHKVKQVEAGIVAESASYLGLLASWAEIATSFPNFITQHPHSGANVQLNTYWKELITCPESAFYAYPLADWKELEDHIIDNLDDTDSSFAFALIRRLRRVLHKQSNDLGAVIVKSSNLSANGKATYTLEHSNADRAAMANIAAGAPSREPTKGDYPNQVAFLRAKIAWNMAKQLSSSQISQAPAVPNITVDALPVSSDDL